LKGLRNFICSATSSLLFRAREFPVPNLGRNPDCANVSRDVADEAEMKGAAVRAPHQNIPESVLV
jgi:hypothetical protein